MKYVVGERVICFVEINDGCSRVCITFVFGVATGEGQFQHFSQHGYPDSALEHKLGTNAY